MSTELGDCTYQAKILGAENRILAIGEVRVYTTDTPAVFWSQDAVNEDLILKSATTAQTSTGHTLKMLKIWRCLGTAFPVSIHYEFDFEEMKT